MRPILRPGTHVLRRDDRTLQVGLDPRTAVVLPDSAEVRRCLELMGRCASLSEYSGRATLDTLTAADLVMDSGTLMPMIPAGGREADAPSRSALAALARSAGDRAADLAVARSKLRVHVASFGPDDGLAEEIRGLVDQAGFGAARSGHRDAALLVGAGEPHRERLDQWMRDGTPHLLVRLSEGCATVGPFVVPGRTACLRCVDAHRADLDPAWPLLVAQYASSTARERADGAPEPLDPMLARVALAWATRDLASYAEGRRPAAWSSTIRLDPHLADVDTQGWLRHPGCGCAWG